LLVRCGLACALATPALASAQNLFDPTRPLRPVSTAPTATAAQALPRLQALIARGARYSALIDGRHLGVGDRIGSWRITAIDRSGVALEGPQGPQRLSLRQAAFKRAVEENTR
jgi:hypothetical protein